MLEILFFVVLASGYNPPQKCFPPSCRIDANCEDSIHLRSGKCCGGVCVDSALPDRLIGEACDVEVYETCRGRCASGSYCSLEDQKCRALPGVGCACSPTLPCASGTCTMSNATSGICVGPPSSVPLGAPCNASAICITGLCSNVTGVCAYLNVGDICSSSTNCGPNATCKLNSSSFTYVCTNRCVFNQSGCCNSVSDCPTGARSCGANATCIAYNGLGELCSMSQDCLNYTTNTMCAEVCNSTGCATEKECQLRHQMADGDNCTQSLQCSVNSTCTGGECVPVPLVPLGGYCSTASQCAPPGDLCTYPCNATACYYTSPICQQKNQIPDGLNCTSTMQCLVNSSCISSRCYPSRILPGQPCVYSSQCASPSVNCGPNNQGDYVCKTNGTTPIGDRCTYTSYAPYEECVKGAECRSILGGNTTCMQKLTVGESCVDSSGSSVRTCNESCAPPRISGTCYSMTNNCTCVAKKVVPDGGACTLDIQCRGEDSSCDIKTGTCRPVVGSDCITMYDCGSSTYKYDCSCDRKCYLLNAPTPPPPPTIAPPPTPPTPGFCQDKWDAWLATGANTTITTSVMTLSNFNSFVVSIRNFSASTQAAAIGLMCCNTCRSNRRFNSPMSGGYQVNCASGVLLKLPDTCDGTRAILALANCWTVSAASGANLGFGVMLAALAALLF